MDIGKLEEEMSVVVKTHKSEDLPVRLLKIAINYLSSKDKTEFLNNHKIQTFAGLHDLRLLAVLNRNHANYFRSLYYLDMIEKNFILSRKEGMMVLDLLLKSAKEADVNYIKHHISYLINQIEFLNENEFMIFYNLVVSLKNKFSLEFNDILNNKKIMDKYNSLTKIGVDITSDNIFSENCTGKSELKWK